MNLNDDLKVYGLVALIKRHIEQNKFQAIELNEARSFDVCMTPRDVVGIDGLLALLYMVEAGLGCKEET